MPSYRVSFINEIPRNDKVFRRVQRSIVIPSADSGASAVEAAKQQFARLEGICDWHLHAHKVEVCQIHAQGDTEAKADNRLENGDAAQSAARRRKGLRQKLADGSGGTTGSHPALPLVAISTGARGGPKVMNVRSAANATAVSRQPWCPQVTEGGGT
jgi:hypothetical protein